MTDEEALAYAEEYNIGADNSADAQLVEEASAGHALNDEDAEGEIVKDPTPPPKTPKSKSGRKSKATAKSTPAVPETIVPPASSSIVPPKPVEKAASPDKKRKRASKGKSADEPVSTIEREEETPRTADKSKKPRNKKSKADS